MFKSLAASALLSSLSATAAVQNTQFYHDLCDASAASPLDDKHFIVGDDEGNTLRVFERNNPNPVRQYDLSRFLIGKKKGSETDLEGAARIGDVIYWISSHGRNKDGKLAPNRQRFFAMRVIAGGRLLEPLGRAYNRLLPDILADRRFDRFGFEAASKLAPKEKGGLNIEAISARPDGSILIGFRNPIPGKKALLLPLLNPAQITEGQSAKFGDMIELDLGGRGVRDITHTGDKFIIIAGRHDTSKDFAIFIWDGKNELNEVKGLKFGDLNPEAIYRFPNDPAGVFQVLSDDGSESVDGKDCKKLPQSKRLFRSAEFTLPQ